MITDLDDARRFSKLRHALGDAGSRLALRDGGAVSMSLVDLESLVGRLAPAPVEVLKRQGLGTVVLREDGMARRAECKPCGWKTGWYSEAIWAYMSDCADDHNAAVHQGEKCRSTCTHCSQLIELVDRKWAHEGGWPLCGAPYPALNAEPAHKTARHS